MKCLNNNFKVLFYVPLLVWSCAGSPTSQDATEFREEVDRLVTSLRIPEERLQAVPRVLEDLQQMLSQRWPGSRVTVYGSIANGLATRTSDIDSTLLLPHRTDTSQTLIRQASDLLRLYPQYISNIQIITYAKIPVITFVHVPTQFQVDFTINNYNAIEISNLLSFIMRMDERVYELAYVVKHWAKERKVTSTQTLPSYGMVLMVIFYLQQRNMLPPIAALQGNAPPNFVDEWNYGFCKIEYYLNNNVQLNLLLGGFFEFYTDFDYDKFVVSPYTGYAIEKHLFTDVNNVPKVLGLYIFNVINNISRPLPIESALLVQDMFIHNLNVAMNADLRHNSTFITQFHYAAEKFRENNSNFLRKIL